MTAPSDTVAERMAAYLSERGTPATVNEMAEATGAGWKNVHNVLFKRNRRRFMRAGTRDGLLLWKLDPRYLPVCDWRDAPPCPGRYGLRNKGVRDDNVHGFAQIDDPAAWAAANPMMRVYGPIPPDVEGGHG